jgi:hypothetical protein
LHYERIIAAEEAYLANKFDKSYTRWAEQTPIFFPRFSGFAANETPFSCFYAFYQEKAGLAAVILSFWFIALLQNDITPWIKIALIVGAIYYAAFYIIGKIIKKKRKNLRSR